MKRFTASASTPCRLPKRLARKIISDYKILTLAITDKEIKALIAKNRLLNLNSNLTEAEARSVATGIALKRAYKKYKITHPISFHTSILAADTFRQQQDVLNCMKPTAENFHVSSKVTPGERHGCWPTLPKHRARL